VLAEGGSFGTTGKWRVSGAPPASLIIRWKRHGSTTQNERVNNQYTFTDVNGTFGYSLATNLYADLKASYNNSFAGCWNHLLSARPRQTDRHTYSVSLV